jgi:hypothetical protein
VQALTDNVNPNFPGVYYVTYTSTDNYGNSSTNTRTVSVALPAAVAGDVNGDGVVDQSELNAVYASYVTNSPWLYLTNVAGLGSTNVSFALSNNIAGGYTVQVSTDLQRFKKYCSHFGARIFGFWRGFGEGAGLQNPVTEPKRRQKPKRPRSFSLLPNGYSIF